MSATRNTHTQSLEEMDAAALMTSLIDSYTNLQRIKSAADQEKEIAYQLKIAKVKLETFGVDTKNLDLC